jgi:hypothetical protein
MSEETTIVAPSVAERVSQLEGESRDKWLETGKLPEVETKTEPASSTGAPEKVAETKNSEAQTEQSRTKPSKREQRILELLNDNKRLSSELEAVKKGGKEKTVETKPPDRAATPEEAQAAATKPALKDFQTYEDWVEALTDWKADQRVSAKFDEDRKSRETAAKTSEIEKSNKEIERIWMERVNESKKLHDDYEKVAFNKDLPIKSGSAVDKAILKKEWGPELLYYLGNHPDELGRINGLDYDDQVIAINDLRSDFEKAPVKKVTKAPPPPAQVNGNGTISADPVDEALMAGNFTKYRDEANARELKNSRKG